MSCPRASCVRALRLRVYDYVRYVASVCRRGVRDSAQFLCIAVPLLQHLRSWVPPLYCGRLAECSRSDRCRESADHDPRSTRAAAPPGRMQFRACSLAPYAHVHRARLPGSSSSPFLPPCISVVLALILCYWRFLVRGIPSVYAQCRGSERDRRVSCWVHACFRCESLGARSDADRTAMKGGRVERGMGLFSAIDTTS